MNLHLLNFNLIHYRQGLSYGMALLFFMILFSPTIYGQADRKAEAKAFILKDSEKYGLGTEQAEELIVSDAYTSKGITHYYFQQTYQGLRVFNALMNVVISPKGESSMTGNRFVTALPKAAEAGIPLVSPEDGITAAAAHLKLRYTKKANLISVDKDAIAKGAFMSKYIYDKGDISTEDIQVELMWVKDIEDRVHLAWNILIYEVSVFNIWNVRVDAITGQVIEKNNYVVSCTYEAKTGLHNEEEHIHSEVEKVDGGMETMVTGDYNIFDIPLESPFFGGRSIVNAPWNRAGAGNPAATLQWHNDGTTTYTITRGNNVWTKEDQANDNETTIGASASSGTSDFNFSYNGAAASPLTNQDAAITNNFFWNNTIHDVMYQYGFDEVSGNFQNDNQGRGGAGSDYVFADAFDGSGTNNANFSTPPDGQKPRMQMYIFTSPTPDVTSDFDNSVITHEYGHGISNRLTGGPANTSCLQNAEQMGEGWSDFFALMLCTNWTSANANQSRPIGSYVVGAGGIRDFPYSYDMGICPFNYNYARANTSVHDIGSVWCSMLWDMTWNIIAMTSTSTDVYHGIGGNNIALQLVMEGLKLQPCSPGFVDGRDAILLADQILYNGIHKCAIWNAFARRGLGFSASQGSSSSMTDGSQAFDIPTGLNVYITGNQNGLSIGESATYTTNITCGCNATQNNVIPTITLPTELTHQSGGTLSGNQVLFPSSNFGLAETKTFTFTASLNNTATLPTLLFLDNVEGAAQFTAAVVGGAFPPFVTTTSAPIYGNTSWFVSDPNNVSERTLTLTTPIAIPVGSNFLHFTHNYNTENTWDGGVVEYSTNGTSWTDASALITQNGYSGTLGSGSALSGRPAFTGNSNGKKETVIDVSSFAGQNLYFRFRFASDASVGAVGWKIDRIWIGGSAPCVNITADAMQSNVSQASDTYCQNITPFSSILGLTCPAPINTCNPVTYPAIPTVNGEGGNTVTFDIPSNTTFPTGVTTVTATVTDAIGNTANCTFDVVIGAAIPTFTTSPAAVSGVVTVCNGASVTLTGSVADEYVWYRNGVAVNYALVPNYTVNGTGSNNVYTLAVANTGLSCLSAQSAPINIVYSSPPAIITPAGPTTFCANTPTVLNANTGAGYNYVWKRGATTVGTNSSSFTPTASGNHNVTVTDANNCSLTSNWLNIIVNPIPVANAGLDKSICINASTSIGTPPYALYNYAWTPATNLSNANIANPTVSPTLATMTAYTLTVTNPSSNCTNTDIVNVTGLELPAIPTLISTPTPVCQGASITLTPTNTVGASQIQWYKNNAILYNQAPAYATVLTASNTSPDDYMVKAKNVAGCYSASSNVISASIKPAPIPTITSTPAAVGNLITVCVPGGTTGTATLNANVAGGAPPVIYSWQQLISNVYTTVGSGSSFTATVTTSANNKNFIVQANYNNGCVKTSTAKVVKLVTSGCVPRLGSDKEDDLTQIILESDLLTAYPNPTEGILNVSIENSQASEGKLVLYNSLGQIIATQDMIITNGKGNETLDLREIAIGIYTLSFQTAEAQKVLKVVKE